MPDTITLIDTGPMVALINRNDPHHARCVGAMRTFANVPLVTTWPCITEAMHLLGRGIGYRAQEELWGFLSDGLIVIHASGVEEQQRMRVLIAQYADRPMDLADASLVAAAENLSARRVFSVDSDFLSYRLANGNTLRIVP